MVASASAPPTRILLYGASGHAAAVADAVATCPGLELVGFLDDAGAPRPGDPPFLEPFFGGREQLPALRASGIRHAFVAIGDCRVRFRLAEALAEEGFELVTIVHARATVAASASLGPGTVVMAGAVVGARSRVGSHAIVNTAATVDHDCRVGDGVHLCPGVHLAGTVTVGPRTFVGIGAAVANNLTIGSDTTLGAGAVVVRDLPSGIVAYGVPARAMRAAG
jgi:sugar O-acyltransferase (sialic acid O-acetyltransferase NeuD family)